MRHIIAVLLENAPGALSRVVGLFAQRNYNLESLTVAPTDDDERQRAIDAGHDLDRVLTTDDLVTTDNCFFAATGITDGDLLRGVRYRGDRISTQSIVMRSRSGTVRVVEAEHVAAKWAKYSR